MRSIRVFLGLAVLAALAGDAVPVRRLEAFPAVPARSTWAPARYQLEYRVTVPEGERVGDPLLLWVPYPVEDEYQRILRAEIVSPYPWEIRTEKRFGNRLVYIDGKTEAQPVVVRFRYEVERLESRGYSPPRVLEEGRLDPRLYRKGDRLVPLDREIREIAREVTRGIRGPPEKVRALYRYVVDAMAYSKEGDGWGHGDAIWACRNRRGNCTDFHSFFIALARSVGIPARFVIGVPIPEGVEGGTIPGYHCWAEVFLEGGWIPLDASEAKKTGRPADFFGTIPPDRIQFTVGRDLILDPPQQGGPLNYFIYPYAERGGREVKGIEREFRFERIKSSG